MTQAQLIWAALLLAQILVVSPFAIFLFLFLNRKQTMSVPADFQTLIDELGAIATNAAATEQAKIDGAVAAQKAADDAAAAQTAQDHTDTVNALTAQIAALKTALGQ